MWERETERAAALKAKIHRAKETDDLPPDAAKSQERKDAN